VVNIHSYNGNAETVVYLHPPAPLSGEQFESSIDNCVAEQKQHKLVLQDSQEAADSIEHELEAKLVCTLVQSFVQKHMLRYSVKGAVTLLVWPRPTVLHAVTSTS